jgi:hypothetical protein
MAGRKRVPLGDAPLGGSWEDIAAKAREQSEKWAEDIFAKPEEPTRLGEPVEVTDPLAWWEKYMADTEGDDSFLLPYRPTPSSYPARPRTQAAGYNRKTKELRVQFRDGTRYVYHDVPPNVWKNFKRVASPGKAVNRVLNNYSYEKETGANIDDRIYDEFRPGARRKRRTRR